MSNSRYQIYTNQVWQLIREMLGLLKHSKRYFSMALDHQSARFRKSFFENNISSHQKDNESIQYSFKLKLHPGQYYSGLAQIRFNIEQFPSVCDENRVLFLDFQGKNINRLHLNSSIIDAEKYWVNGRILLANQHLKVGENHVIVSYDNKYDKDGSGCVSFIDVDNKQYLYTQFQPYMANRVFPLFDQPDLKAKMSLSIACPSKWKQVISNEFQNQNSQKLALKKGVCEITDKLLKDYQRSIPQNYKVISFNQTKLLPTYLYCFVVGPYKKLVCQNTYKNIPMNLYCIESLYPYMVQHSPFIEEMTNKSMAFFEKYFGHPYPFNKYDQVFAHQYKWGAMENAGIVTLNDLYIFKDPVSVEKMLGFGNTIVHEMAHHWFGNLVTMKWWDDLWLNESFAEYISHYCLQKIKKDVTTLDYQSAMASFLSRKNWGYTEDQLITTHPIRSQVQNTDIAQSIFDGITYSKGAATMKQLMYLMGEQQFSKSLSSYFTKFAFKNAELNDLLASLTENYHVKSGLSLSEWKQMWLQRQGLNILSGNVTEDGNLSIVQQNYHGHHQTLRSHMIKVAFFDTNLIQSLEVLVQPQKQTIIELSGQWKAKAIKSKAILINHQDLTFAKVIANYQSLNFFNSQLHKINDVLTRSLIWKIFYEMVRDAHRQSLDYIVFVTTHLFFQVSDNLLEENLNRALMIINKYTPHKYRSDLMKMMRDNLQSEWKKNGDKMTQNRRVIVRDKLISFADPENEEHMKKLKLWLYGENSDEMKSPNITESWKILDKLFLSPFFENNIKKQLFNTMCEKDKSDTAKNKRVMFEALVIEEKELDRLFSKYVEGNDWTMVQFQHSIAGFNSLPHKKIIHSKFRTLYISILKEILLRKKIEEKPVLKNNQMMQIFIEGMDPITEDDKDDINWKIQKYSQLEKCDNQKMRIKITKKIEVLKKRQLAYMLYG